MIDKKLFEEIDLIATDDEDTLCKCLHCEHEQYVPSWLIGEIDDMNKECGSDDYFITGYYRCNCS